MIILPKDIKRFFKYVNKTDTCWLWTGAKKGYGYGVFNLHYKTTRSHRLSAIIHNTPNPNKKPYVLHSCDTPACVNPKHLFWGTQKDNMVDMIVKCRGRYGGEITTDYEKHEIHIKKSREWRAKNKAHIKMYNGKYRLSH